MVTCAYMYIHRITYTWMVKYMLFDDMYVCVCGRRHIHINICVYIYVGHIYELASSDSGAGVCECAILSVSAHIYKHISI